MHLLGVLCGGLCVSAALSGALAEPARGPELHAASNFGQTWNQGMFDAARAAGMTALRDEIHWDFAERDGVYVFDHDILTYPDLMAQAGMRLTLIAGGEHPDHDAGATPHSHDAVAALATHDAVRAALPDAWIIGGAAHSIPLAWFGALSADGAGDDMDSVARHPTPPGPSSSAARSPRSARLRGLRPCRSR